MIMVSMLTRIHQWKQNELTQLNLRIKVTESSQAPCDGKFSKFQMISENKYPKCSVVLRPSCSSLKYLCVISLLPYSIWWFMTNASKAYLSTIFTVVNPPMFFLSVLGSNPTQVMCCTLNGNPTVPILYAMQLCYHHGHVLYCLILWPVSHKRLVPFSGQGRAYYSKIEHVHHQLSSEFTSGITAYKVYESSTNKYLPCLLARVKITGRK